VGRVAPSPEESVVLTVFVIIALAAFICAVLAGAGYPPPLWVSVLLLCVIELLRALPVGK